MRELEHLLPELEPPRGGLARLRQRIADNDRRRGRYRRRLRWGLAVALPLLVVAALLPAPLLRWQHTRALTRELRAALQPSAPVNGLRVEHGAALPLPSGQANVQLYLVQSSAPAVNRAKAGNPR